MTFPLMVMLCLDVTMLSCGFSAGTAVSFAVSFTLSSAIYLVLLESYCFLLNAAAVYVL
jgi:ABC-type siderophore export system fused ATPase/permease subunit